MSKKNAKPIVAVVGRPNVGKSTLFNALAGENISIVKDMPGITRDRIYADISWQDLLIQIFYDESRVLYAPGFNLKDNSVFNASPQFLSLNPHFIDV